MNRLRAGVPLTVAGFTLIPIERLRIDSGAQPHGCWLNGTKEAVAVVIRGPGGPLALDIEGKEMPLEELLAQVPGLVLEPPFVR